MQTIPPKYLWVWIATVHICLELEMFPNIPAMCDIIPLTWANRNCPSCKQDVKRALRRLKTTFSKPSGGGSWGFGSKTWIGIKSLCKTPAEERKAPTPTAAGTVYRPGMGCRIKAKECVQATKNVSSIPRWCFALDWRLCAHQSCSITQLGRGENVTKSLF